MDKRILYKFTGGFFIFCGLLLIGALLAKFTGRVELFWKIVNPVFALITFIGLGVLIFALIYLGLCLFREKNVR